MGMVLTGLRILIPKSQPREQPALPFMAGDHVRLKEKNPYKGALQCGKLYTVQFAIGEAIGIVADNGTKGCFKATHFEECEPDRAAEGAAEYADIMEAQELMNGI